jgi:hypothetical protein
MMMKTFLKHPLTNILWVIFFGLSPSVGAFHEFLGQPVLNFQNIKISFWGFSLQDSFSVFTFMLSINF